MIVICIKDVDKKLIPELAENVHYKQFHPYCAQLISWSSKESRCVYDVSTLDDSPLPGAKYATSQHIFSNAFKRYFKIIKHTCA